MAKSNTKTPTHEVFHVVEPTNKSDSSARARWTKIGIGFENRDGQGMNLIINYTPLVSGNTVVRKIKANQEDAA